VRFITFFDHIATYFQQSPASRTLQVPQSPSPASHPACLLPCGLPAPCAPIPTSPNRRWPLWRPRDPDIDARRLDFARSQVQVGAQAGAHRAASFVPSSSPVSTPLSPTSSRAKVGPHLLAKLVLTRFVETYATTPFLNARQRPRFRPAAVDLALAYTPTARALHALPPTRAPRCVPFFVS